MTTGAANDIEKATRIARAMVTQYGMSEKFGLMGLEHQENEYLTGRVVMNCGDATAAEVDQEVMKILKKSYEEAKRLLSENRDAHGQDCRVPDSKGDHHRQGISEDLPRGERNSRARRKRNRRRASHAQVKAEVPRPESLQPEKEQEEAAPLNAENTEAEQSGAAQNAEPENGGHVEDAEKQNEEM